MKYGIPLIIAFLVAAPTALAEEPKFREYKIRPGDTFSKVIHRESKKRPGTDFRKFLKFHEEKNKERYKNLGALRVGDKILILEKEPTNRKPAMVYSEAIFEPESPYPFSLGVKQSVFFQYQDSKDLTNDSSGKFSSTGYATRLRIGKVLSRKIGLSLDYQLTRLNYKDLDRTLENGNLFTHAIALSGRFQISRPAYLTATYEFAEHTFPRASSSSALRIDRASLHGVAVGYHQLLLFTRKARLGASAILGSYLFGNGNSMDIKTSWFVRLGPQITYDLSKSWLLSGALTGEFSKIASNLVNQSVWKSGVLIGLTYTL